MIMERMLHRVTARRTRSRRRTAGRTSFAARLWTTRRRSVCCISSSLSLLLAVGGCSGDDTGEPRSTDATEVSSPTSTDGNAGASGSTSPVDTRAQGNEGGSAVDQETMMAWVETVVDFGIRRTGYPEEAEVARWLVTEFERAGLEDVRLEPVEVNRWVPSSCEVTWWSDAEPDSRSTATCFSLPYSQPQVDVTLPAVADTGTEDLTGAVGVFRNRFPEIPQKLFADESLEVLLDSATLAEDAQPIPFGVRNGALFGDFFESTTSRGGAGMIGVIENLGTHEYYAPYTGVNVDIPAVWMDEDSGNDLLAAIETGSVTVSIKSSAERQPVESANVVGFLPGSTDEDPDAAHNVVIGSHYDAPWASAVEDATGIAQVLAQATWWASVPRDERPNDLTFVLATGHMSGAAGSHAFVDSHADLLDRTVLTMYLEHVALRPEMTEAGMTPTAEPEVRWWFVTDRQDLRDLVVDALKGQGMNRDLILPDVGFFGAAGPLSDAAPHTWAGVPIASMISAPAYLFDPRDTVEMVDAEGMEIVFRAARDMVSATHDLALEPRQVPDSSGP